MDIYKGGNDKTHPVNKLTFLHLNISTQSNQSVLDMFHPKHAWRSIKTIFLPREDGRRIYLFLLVVAIAFEIAPFVGRGQVEYLYVRSRFGWEVDEYSLYSSVDSAIGICGITIRYRKDDLLQ